MTSALKIRCFLKTTAKKFCSRAEGERGRKKSDVLRKEEEEEGGGGGVWGVGGCVTREASSCDSSG